MAVEALERAEFVTREAWRNTGHVHLALTVLAARTRQHAKGRIGRQCVRVGHVRPRWIRRVHDSYGHRALTRLFSLTKKGFAGQY